MPYLRQLPFFYLPAFFISEPEDDGTVEVSVSAGAAPLFRGNVHAGLFYSSGSGNMGAGEWLKEKAMAWLPLAEYVEDHVPYEETIEDEETIAKILESQANDENMVDENGNLIGEPDESEKNTQAAPAADISIEKLRDFDYLLSNFYIVDSSTMIGPEQLNVDDLLNRSMKINTETDGPKVLIYHTHSQEEFKDSTPGDPRRVSWVWGHISQNCSMQKESRQYMTPEFTIL